MTDARTRALDRVIARGIARHEARWLIEEFYVGSEPDADLALERATQRRLDGEPLQYIVGHWPFRSLDLEVDARVLIPRPETEELVDLALEELAHSDVRTPLIVDLGCGSGAIGLALAKELGERGVLARIVAVDESEDALDVARRNARRWGLSTVSFVRSQWYDELDTSLEGRVDLIVSNPPYVSVDELAQAQVELSFEPAGALVAADRDGVAGFDDLATIIDGAPRWLRPGGSLVLEHGSEQAPAVVGRLSAVGFHDVDDRRDVAGLARLARGRWG